MIELIQTDLGANLIFFGSGVAFLVAFGQLLKAPKKNVHWVSAFMFICVGFWQFHIAFSLYQTKFFLLPILSIIHYSAASAFGPLLYAYSRIITDANFSPWEFVKISVILACVSVLILAICCVIQITQSPTIHWQDIVISVFADYKNPPLSKPLRYFSFLPQVIVIVSVFFILKNYFTKKDTKDNMRKLKIWASYLLVLTSLSAFFGIFVELRVIGALFAMFTVSSFFLVGHRLSVFFELSPPGQRQDTRLQSIDKVALRKKLIHVMEKEHIYRVEELNLSMLSESISTEKKKISPEQLSEFINLEHNKNFNSFVNDYRINEAKRLLLSNSDMNVLSIGLEVGFNSKSTFYNAFKNSTGKTPIEFRKEKLVGIFSQK